MNKIFQLFTLLLLGNSLAESSVYYVATNGDDTSSGISLEQPFATIQKAVNQMKPGDTCYIRGGVYRETVDLGGKAGALGLPLTLTSYQGEKAILDGTSEISGEWVLDEGNVYKAIIDQDVTQLFVDGKMMTLARYPNAPVWSDLMWSVNGARLKKRRDQGSDSHNGQVVDSGKLGGQRVSFTDCVAVMNFAVHFSSARLVEGHVAGTDVFYYSPELRPYHGSLYYFLEGGRNNAERVMLDSPEEWSFDESTKTLYLWPTDGETPEGREIFGKTKTYGIIGDAETRYVVIDGIDFFASAFEFVSSDNISIKNCDLNFPTASKRALGDTSYELNAHFTGDVSDFCVDNTVYNCAFRYCDGAAFTTDFTEGTLVENCLFYNVNYSGINASIGVANVRSRDLVYRRNTMAVVGTALSMRPSQYGEDKGSRPQVVEYNFFTRCGLQQTDGTALYLGPYSSSESLVRYNWFINNNQKDFRLDGNGVSTKMSERSNYYRNVAMSGDLKPANLWHSGAHFKGDSHEIYNNLGLNKKSAISIPRGGGGNENTITRNNAADIFFGNSIQGVASNNYGVAAVKKPMNQLLRDPENWDFRPRADAAELIDKGELVTCTVNEESIDVTAGFIGSAPDIGVYEFGDDVYWIPGRQESKASMPIPKMEGKNVSLKTDLMYLIGLEGVKGITYLGSDPSQLNRVTTTNNPNNIVELSGANELKAGSKYYWRVDTELADGSVVLGDIWTFTTEVPEG